MGLYSNTLTTGSGPGGLERISVTGSLAVLLNLDTAANLSVSGSANLGNAPTDTHKFFGTPDFISHNGSDKGLTLGGDLVTSTAAELNLLDGVSGLGQADFTKLAAVNASADELNIMDGDTAATATTLVAADRVPVNDDDGSMVQVAMSDFETFMETNLDTLNAVTSATALAAVGTITSGAWNGTAVASAYLDTDTAHLSVAQAFTGNKDFGVDGTGVDVIFYGDTAGSNMTWDQSDDALELTDDVKLKIGADADGDMSLYHDGTDSYITNKTGVLKIATETSGILVSIGNASSETTINDNLTVTGDLTVNGSTVTINTTTVQIDDLNLQLADGDAAASAVDGGGITLAHSGDDFTWDYNHASTAWKSSIDVDVLTGKAYKVNGTSVLNSATLGTGVVNSSLTSVGIITSLVATTVDVNDALGVSGAADFSSTLNVNGASTLAAITADGAIDFSSTLNVDGVSTMGAITSDGAISTTSTLNADGAVTLGATGVATTVNGTFNVDQAATFATTLGVTGLATLAGVDIANGEIDGTVIGADSARAGTFTAVVGTSLSVSDGNITNVSSIACDSVVVAEASVGLDIVMGGTTGLNKVTLTDGLASALDITEGSNSYIKFTTTDSSELITFGEDVDINGGAIDGTVIGGASALAGTFTTLSATGDVTLGNHYSDQIACQGRFTTDLLPWGDNSMDLGSEDLRWQNIYTGDLHLANDRGNYTMVEEEDMLTIRNNRTGKWFKLMMEEIDPDGRDEGMNGAPPVAGGIVWEI